MTIKALKVYRIFRRAYDNEDAKTIVTFIMNRKQNEINEMKKVFLTKDDKLDLMRGQADMQKAQADMQASFLKGQADMQATLLRSQMDIINMQKSDKTEILGIQKKDKTELLGLISKLRDEMYMGFSTIELRLDTHFKWLIGIMITLFGLALTLHKLL